MKRREFLGTVAAGMAAVGLPVAAWASSDEALRKKFDAAFRLAVGRVVDSFEYAPTSPYSYMMAQPPEVVVRLLMLISLRQVDSEMSGPSARDHFGGQLEASLRYDFSIDSYVFSASSRGVQCSRPICGSAVRRRGRESANALAARDLDRRELVHYVGEKNGRKVVG